jgi:hypothetical protein
VGPLSTGASGYASRMRTLLLAMWLLPVAVSAQTSLTFQGQVYLHRWSKGTQHEFTPRGQEDLEKWTDMVTVIVREDARDGEQLAQWASAIATQYGTTGRVLRTDSSPRTKDREAEHFVAAVFGSPQWLEAAFANVALREGRGVVVVHSHRVYGTAVGDTMSKWLEENAPATETALRAFKGVPTLAALRALPQATDTAVPPAPPAASGREQAVKQLAWLGYPNPSTFCRPSPRAGRRPAAQGLGGPHRAL